MPLSRSRRLAITAAAGIVGLCACATKPTPYMPATATSGYGYSEQQIEQNRFRINFRGNAATPPDRVDTYLLYRAAELAKAQGFDSFILSKHQIEVAKRSGGGPTLSIGGMGFGGGSTAIGGGAGFTFGGGARGSLYETYADVLMKKGPKAPGDVQAYSTDEVLARLQGTVKPAPGK